MLPNKILYFPVSAVLPTVLSSPCCKVLPQFTSLYKCSASINVFYGRSATERALGTIRVEKEFLPSPRLLSLSCSERRKIPFLPSFRPSFTYSFVVTKQELTVSQCVVQKLQKALFQISMYCQHLTLRL